MKRIDYLHGLRGFAALTVVLSHCTPSFHDPIGHAWNNVIFYLGTLAVPTFIMLSGYVLALPLVRDGTLKGGYLGFMTRRANRILPAYEIAVLFGFLVGVFVTKETSVYAVFAGQFWAVVALMHDFLYTRPDWNRPLWSMAIEWHIYFFAPLLYWGWRAFGIVRASMAAIAVTLIGMFAVERAGFDMALISFYTLFVVGGIAAQVVHSDRETAVKLRDFAHWKPLAAGLLLAFAILGVGIGTEQWREHPEWINLMWSIPMLASLIALHEPSRPQRFFASRLAVAAGTISYSLYLLHYPIVDTITDLTSRLSQWESYAIVILTAIPLSLAVATGSYWLFERPYLMRGQKKSAPTPIVAVEPAA